MWFYLKCSHQLVVKTTWNFFLGLRSKYHLLSKIRWENVKDFGKENSNIFQEKDGRCVWRPPNSNVVEFPTKEINTWHYCPSESAWSARWGPIYHGGKNGKCCPSSNSCSRKKWKFWESFNETHYYACDVFSLVIIFGWKETECIMKCHIHHWTQKLANFHFADANMGCVPRRRKCIVISLWSYECWSQRSIILSDPLASDFHFHWEFSQKMFHQLFVHCPSC